LETLINSLEADLR